MLWLLVWILSMKKMILTFQFWRKWLIQHKQCRHALIKFLLSFMEIIYSRLPFNSNVLGNFKYRNWMLEIWYMPYQFMFKKDIRTNCPYEFQLRFSAMFQSPTSLHQKLYLIPVHLVTCLMAWTVSSMYQPKLHGLQQTQIVNQGRVS